MQAIDALDAVDKLCRKVHQDSVLIQGALIQAKIAPGKLRRLWRVYTRLLNVIA